MLILKLYLIVKDLSAIYTVLNKLKKEYSDGCYAFLERYDVCWYAKITVALYIDTNTIEKLLYAIFLYLIEHDVSVLS